MGGELMSDIFLEAMKQEGPKKTEPESRGLLKKGKVVAVSATDVFLDMGSKSECLVPLSEFDKKPVLGDEIEVVVKDMQDGVNIASIEDAKKIGRMNTLKKALEEGLPVSGTIEDPIYKDGVPKGFTVNMGFDIKAFLPLSQIDVRKEEKLENMKGTVVDFAVIEMKHKNMTVSRREFLQKTVKKLYVQFFEVHKEGDKVHGKVERIEEDFVVLTVEGIRALLHVSDFSWKYLSDMKRVVKLGDEMDLVVTKIDQAKNFVKVSRKPLIPNPWDGVENKFHNGDVVKGKIVSFRREGAMVEIDDGIDAFLPVSEMSWTEKVRDPRRYVSQGTLVEVKIRNIDQEKRRMEVSLRDIQENPWNNAETNYSLGRKVKGVVTSVVDFGVFIKFPDGIEGLMRKEDADWTDSNVDLKTKFKKGDEVEVIVLSIDRGSEKLRIGFKQLSDNPYQMFTMNYPKGAAVKVTIKEVQDNGVIVSMDSTVDGYIHISQLSKEKVEKISDAVKVGDTATAVVRSIDASKNRIELSIKEYLMNEEKIESSRYMAEPASKGTGTLSMGDMLKEQFANIKVTEKKNAKKSKAE